MTSAMHASTASREVTGNRAVFVVVVGAIAGGAVVTVVVTVAGRDVKTGVRISVDECLSGLRVYDVPPLIDTFEVCGS